MQDSALQLILHAGLFVKIILLILAGFSIISWAIILYKYFHLTAAAKESEQFLKAFDGGGDAKDLMAAASRFALSPLANVFRAVYPAHGRGRRDEVTKLLRRSQTQESEKLHAYLTFLATTGSTSPFIGLLGTVWGIMNAFRGIGATGSASLAVVAPGIAEALITTAAGLGAAIPAVMAYNYYLSWVRKITMQVEDFAEPLRELVTRGAA